jgi:hypothetical protein
MINVQCTVYSVQIALFLLLWLQLWAETCSPTTLDAMANNRPESDAEHCPSVHLVSTVQYSVVQCSAGHLVRLLASP